MPVQDAPWNRPAATGSQPDPAAAPTTDGLDPAALHALYGQMVNAGQRDRAWCAAAALSFVGAADPAETECFEQHRPSRLPATTGRLTHELWASCLLHQDEDPTICGLLAIITPAAAQIACSEATKTGTAALADPRFRQDPGTSTIAMAKTFGWAGSVLGVYEPELYVRPDVFGAMLVLPRAPLATLAGMDAMSGMGPHELAFACAAHLALYRGEHFVRSLFPDPDEITALVLAARAVSNPSVRLPPGWEPRVQALSADLARRLNPVQHEALRAHERLIRDRPTEPDPRAWARAVELTQCRAGLLLCGDLAFARHALQRSPDSPGSPSLPEKLRDLAAFSVSEQYSRLRQHLGIAVGAQGSNPRGPRPEHPWVQPIHDACAQLPTASSKPSLVLCTALGAAVLLAMVVAAVILLAAQ